MIKLWHCHLMHIKLHVLYSLSCPSFAKRYLYIPMSLQVCAICRLGKQHRSHAPKESMNKTSKINELIQYLYSTLVKGFL
jgi:hypothetical protein